MARSPLAARRSPLAARRSPLAARRSPGGRGVEIEVEQLRHDAEFMARVAEKLGLVGRPELRTIEELIENDEDYA
jgi:hypothetical protein